MKCPRCGAEADGMPSSCPACGTVLAPVPPDPMEDVVPVLATRDATLLPVVTSLLEAEGIPCGVENAAGERVWGWGGGPIQYGDLVHAVRVVVARENEQAARELIAAQVPPEALEAAAEESHE